MTTDPSILEALKLARTYVGATHASLVGAVGNDNLVSPDLAKIDAAIAAAQPMSPDDIESQRRYHENMATISRDRVLRHMRSMVTSLEKGAAEALARPSSTARYHEDMQQAILWNVWNCGLAELLHAGHMVAAFDQQYPPSLA